MPSESALAPPATVRRLARNPFTKAWRESGGTGRGAYDVEMRQLGLEPGVELVELGPITPPRQMAERLGSRRETRP